MNGHRPSFLSGTNGKGQRGRPLEEGDERMPLADSLVLD